MLFSKTFHSFPGHFTRVLSEFRITSPYVATQYGSFLTYNLDKFSGRSEIVYMVKAFGQEILLEVTRNKRLVTADFASETMQNSRHYFSRVSSSCYLTGKVKGKKHSSVAISNCNGLVSF